jgi:putative spermidine/putrescine transport system ATP-binding protein
MSLQLDNVSYQYPGSAHGLHGVSLQVNTGELVAVIGPSGSGKSTLLQLVSGLLSGHSGTIALNGKNLAPVPVHQRNMGMVFQSYALFPHLSVIDNIAYGLKLRGMPLQERRTRAQELLETIGLAHYATRAVSQLSGGQQQRVALARALAINPSALLLDEPLAALDASIRGHLRDQIRQLQQQFKATTLLVTHDQEEALTMADRVAVLKDGHLLQFSTPKDIYKNPRSKAVAEFVGLSTIFQATVIDNQSIDLGFAKLITHTGQRSMGQKVFALIRPEHVCSRPTPDTLNLLKGQVTMQRYLGSVYRYDFAVAGAAKPLLAQAPQVAQDQVSVAPQHIHLLDE